MIQHVRNREHFTIGQKLKLVHQLGIDLEKTRGSNVLTIRFGHSHLELTLLVMIVLVKSYENRCPRSVIHSTTNVAATRRVVGKHNISGS